MPYALEPPTNFLEILQRVWWRLDRALDEDSVRASALVGGMEALLSGTTTLVDHHASPNAIDGSLDVIADALGSLGVRSVLCYETTDRDGPERALAGLAENRRFLARRSEPRRSRAGWSARTRRSRSPTRRSPRARDRRTSGRLHVHAAEDGVDARRGRARSSDARRASTSTRCSRTASISTKSELALVRAANATVAHNAALEHEQLASAARPSRCSARGSRSAPTGSAPTCSRSRTRRTSACARTTSAPLARLAARAPRRVRPPRRPGLRRAAARHARARRARRSRRPRLPGARSRHRRELRRPLDLRAVVAARSRRDGRRRVGRPRPPSHPRRPGRARRRARCEQARAPLAASRRASPPHTFEPKGGCQPWTA